MNEPRLSITVQTSDGRRVGFNLDLPHRQVQLVVTALREMAARLSADAQQQRRDAAPATKPDAQGRSSSSVE